MYVIIIFKLMFSFKKCILADMKMYILKTFKKDLINIYLDINFLNF
jgi:hypothetical protein